MERVGKEEEQQRSYGIAEGLMITGVPIVYLAGPINNCTDSECKDWRKELITTVQDMIFFDPMTRDYRGKEDESVAEIVEKDKADIDASDVLLVKYDKPSVGTSMEVLYAWERDKQVVIVADSATKISPWLRYHSHKIVSSFSDALQFIRGTHGHSFTSNC